MSVERPDDVHRTYVPPVEVIEDALFRPAAGSVAEDQDGAVLSFMDIAVDESGMAWNPEAERVGGDIEPHGDGAMPAALRQFIRQRLSARRAFQSQGKHEAGMIVQVEPPASALNRLSMDLPVLLDRLMPDSGTWRGWVAVPQTHVAYVSYWDLLLEEELDGPFDPAAGIIQTWNAVYVKVAEAALVLGRVDRARLSAVRALEHEFERGLPEDAGEPDAGRFGMREAAGFSVVTGTPLGNACDERRNYQRLYSLAAAALSEQASEYVADALAEGWLTRIARNLEQWAADAGVIFAPRSAIPEPMGAGKHASLYLLGQYAHLSLHPYPNEQALHVQITAIGDTIIEVILRAGDEVMQTSNIGKSNWMADFFMDLRLGHVLTIRIPKQGIEFEVPIT